MPEISTRAFDIVPEYGPTLVWHDLWTDELAGEGRREWFWDRYMYELKEQSTIKVVVYPRDEEIYVSEENIRRSVVHVECLACGGTGTFYITDDDSQECVPCSGTGEVPVSL